MFADSAIWLIDITIFVSLWILGLLIVRALIPDSSLAEQLALGYGCGIGSLTWLLFLASWAGIPINAQMILIIYSLLVVIAIVENRHTNWPIQINSSTRRATALNVVGWAIFVSFCLFLFIISIGLSYSMWDAMAIWSVKGYGIGSNHTIFAADLWGAKGLAYPLNLPLAISVFYTFSSDLLPGSKLIFTGFFVAMLIGLRVLFNQQRLPDWFAWCSVFLIGTIPILVQYSLLGYANIPFAYYYVIGVTWIGFGLTNQDSNRMLIGSILLAFSIWTRVEGLEFWIIAITGLVILWQRSMINRKIILTIACPALIIGGSWIVFGQLFHAETGETDLLKDSLSRILHGEIYPIAAYRILRFTGYLFIKTQVYGIIAPALISLAFISLILIPNIRKEKLAITLFFSGVITFLGVMFMYYLTSYDQNNDLIYWLGTGYDRMLFGSVILLTTSSILILWKTLISKEIQ